MGHMNCGSKFPPPLKQKKWKVFNLYFDLEMNRVGGEGCTKLEILLFVLRKYKPKENITHVTNKLLEVLELGIKKGKI